MEETGQPRQNSLEGRKQHLLIIGAPRSGTTLLTAMIGRHREVALLNEDKGWAMRSIVSKRVVGNKRCIPNQIELKKRGIFQLRLFKELGLIREYQSSRYSIEDYLQLPDIKIIAIIRDGNDVISSIIRRSEKDFKGASYRWCRAIEIVYELKTRYDDKVMIVSFEDLVVHPEANMKRAASFLGLDFEEEMVEGYKYNPYYPEGGLNREKVHRSEREAIDFGLAEKFPSICRKYRELVAMAK